jgi:murein DD-endopeptidase MepM/ murein hydrolase activator NlpD
MAWRAAVSGLVLAVILAPPPALSQTSVTTDEVVILSTYRSYNGANNRPRLRRHAGVDFGGQLGAPVLASADGVVSRILNWPPGCGNGVVIEHPGFKRWTAYCHMQSLTVSQGQRVSRAEQIGLVGMSGKAVNIPHVHMELCTVACASHADGDLSGTADPLAIADGCFAPDKTYPRDHLVLTFPVTCLVWIRGR